MKKTLFTALAVLAFSSGLAQAAYVYQYVGDITTSSGAATSFSKDDGVTITLTKSKGNFFSTSGTWSNEMAYESFLDETGFAKSEVTVESLSTYTAPGMGGSHSTLTLDFSGATTSSSEDYYTFFLTVGATGDVLSSITINGLSVETFEYALESGSGFMTDGTISDNTLSFTGGAAGKTTLIKVIGTRAEGVDSVTFTSTAGKNGFGMVAYQGQAVTAPEPATASLSLLGLGALMLRRRRA